MDVSVVIPTLNGGAVFQECLQRILRQRDPAPRRVLCIDSGSHDGTAEFARRFGAEVVTIDKERFNHGATRNQAITRVQSEYIALTVQDAWPCDDRWLFHLVHALETVPGAAGAYSRQIPRDDCDPIIRDRLMNWTATRSGLTVQGLEELRAWADLDPREKLGLIAFDNVSSCIRRSCWNEIPFPPLSFGEDVAWASEVIRRGYRIIYEPASAVVHSHNNSVWYEFKRIYADHQNLNRLIGLTTVPRVQNVLSNGRGAFRHYLNLLNKANLPKRTLLWKKLRAFPYAYLENLAQYLGAKMRPRLEQRHPMAVWMDGILKKGV